MPAKKTTLTDAERAKRILETAGEVGTGNDPATFDHALEKVMQWPSGRGKIKRREECYAGGYVHRGYGGYFQ